MNVEAPTSTESREQQDAAYDELTAAVRELLDATVRSKVGAAEVSQLAAQVRSVSKHLLIDAHPGPVGRLERAYKWGGNPANPVDGRRNAMAPPLKVTRDEQNQRVWATFNLGAPYEGPPDHIHGGISALLLDQVMGMVPSFALKPRATAYLNVSYRRPTPLMTELSVEAWLDRVEGRKVFIKGRITDPQGQPTVEAEGLFVVLDKEF